ncbi:MAG TPA: hypothetical protein ENF25_00345 [Thermoprotei archaeon]|nr:hypothetical protein [Euryarchaeota archaeon]MCD6158499.1 hypothetical protein [Euryarchaeota archaeon]HDJ50637.1 hypothetical protein [Thermoprotei archaeon]
MSNESNFGGSIMEGRERITKLALIGIALVIIIAGIAVTGYALWDKSANVTILIEVPKSIISDKLESAFESPDNVTLETTIQIYTVYLESSKTLYEKNVTYVFKSLPDYLLAKLPKSAFPTSASQENKKSSEFTLGVKLIVRPKGFSGNETLEMTYEWEGKYTCGNIPSTINASPS